MSIDKTMEDNFNEQLEAKQEEVNKLQADLDYVAIMTGVDLDV